VGTGGFSGAVSVVVANLPLGVTADPLSLAAGTTSGAITLHADAQAPLSVAGVLTIRATSNTLRAPDITLPIIVQDPSGTPDTTFATDGVAVLTSGVSIAVHGLAIQADGGIVYCGDDPTNGLAIGRLTTGGAYDTTFAGTGHTTLMATGFDNEVCQAVSPVADGLLVAGFAQQQGHSSHMMFGAKITAAGTMSPGFGNGSGLVPLVDNEIDSKAYAMGVAPDGKVVLGGFRSWGNSSIVRLTSTGGSDPLFDPTPTGNALIGVNVLQVGSEIDQVAVLPAGDVLIATRSTQFQVTHLTSQGRVEPLYGVNGTATLSLPASLTSNPDLVAESDGSVVVVGSVPGAIQLARFQPNGQPDTAFGQGGLVTVSTSLVGTSIARLPEGGYAVGLGENGVNIGALKLRATGEVDAHFGTNGIRTVPTTALNQPAIAVDAAGRILVASGGGGSAPAAIVARFWP
jgi:uncharacterized delta-60 repeat protein